MWPVPRAPHFSQSSWPFKSQLTWLLFSAFKLLFCPTFIVCFGRRVSSIQVFPIYQKQKFKWSGNLSDPVLVTGRHVNTLNGLRYSSILLLNPLLTQLLNLPACFCTPPTYSKLPEHRDSGLDASLDELPVMMWVKGETCLSYLTVLPMLMHPMMLSAIWASTPLVYYSESKYHIFHPFCIPGNCGPKITQKSLHYYYHYHRHHQHHQNHLLTENVWRLQIAFSGIDSEGGLHLTSSNQKGAEPSLAMGTEYCNIWFFKFWPFQFWQTATSQPCDL